MTGSRISRRDVVIGSSALVAGAAFSTKVMSAAPPASAVTPQLIEAAKKEGKVVWYTSTPIEQGQKIADAFQKEYGIKVEMFRSGGSEILRRFQQEMDAGRVAVDVLTHSEPAAATAAATARIVYLPTGRMALTCSSIADGMPSLAFSPDSNRCK